MRIKKISILTHNYRSYNKVQNFSLKSKKDFQIKKYEVTEKEKNEKGSRKSTSQM
jgi:hypothetical protein